jgi:hypothetical protein
MRAGSEPLLFGPPAARQKGRKIPLGPFLALTLFLPAMIVISNFVIGALTPITAALEDDMMLIDRVWRLVQGFHLGIDFHDPFGFGLPQVAAMLWRLLGPHYYVLGASVDLFAFIIVLCSCVVATRQLRHVAGLAVVFCITVAFEASGSSIYGLTHDFGMSLTHDRLVMSGLVVLFVQSFANNSDTRRERGFIDHFTAAFLLNILFLVKISGLVVGIAILVGGCIVRGRLSRCLVEIPLVLLFLAVMMAINFIFTGTDLSSVIQEYRLAGQARAESYSLREALWFASRLPVFGVVVFLALYAVSWRDSKSSGSLWRCFLIIAFYWVCQVALNMSNSTLSPSLIYLAPAAAVSLVTWTDTSDTAGFWEHLWNRPYPRRLRETSPRKVIPLLVLALVVVPEALASLTAVKLDYSILSGTTSTIAVTANKGITFKVLDQNRPQAGRPPPTDPYNTDLALSINRAVQVIEELGASRETIANLEFMNPFPALFLAPDPKGVSVYWDFSKRGNRPIGYRPSWQEIIGDACIVTEPKHPIRPASEYSEPLINAVAPHLMSTFTLVYQDELWKIWKHSSGCGATAFGRQ